MKRVIILLLTISLFTMCKAQYNKLEYVLYGRGGLILSRLTPGGALAIDQRVDSIKIVAGVLHFYHGVTDLTVSGEMTYPGNGIPLAVNGAWGTSITNNSSNWNTAYGWGNWALNFGTASGTIAQGNDSRILNGQIAFGWNNHALAGYATPQTVHDTNQYNIDNGTLLSSKALIAADSNNSAKLAYKFPTKKHMRDYVAAHGGTTSFTDSLKVLSSNPAAGNVYIHSGDKKIHYKVGGYWHRLAILDSAATSGGSSTLLNGLLGYWKLDESSGNALDDVGSNDGTLLNTPTQNVAGKVGTAYSFADASSESVDIGEIAAFKVPVLTISACFKTSTSSYDCVASMISGGLTYGWHITTELTKLRCRVGDGAGGHSATAESTTSVNTNAWYHVVLTSDGTNLKMYINGTQEGGNQAFPYDIDYLTGANAHLRIGARGDTPSAFWNGSADEVGIWDRALGQAGVDSLWTKINAGTSHPFTP